MGLRRSGREAAASILYSMEFSESGHGYKEASDSYWENRGGSDALKKYSVGLTAGVSAHSERIDEEIAAVSKNWSLERLSLMDKSILRVAIFELLECGDVPTAVAVNEAVEIARDFAGEESANFLNGMLRVIAKRIRPEEKLPDEPLEG